MGQMMVCVSLVQSWMRRHQLKMNEAKTEYLIISSKQMANKVSPTPLVIGNNEIAPSSSARNLGVVFDKFATMEAHVNGVCRLSYMQLRNISKLRPYLDQQSLECLVHGFITSRLDYCNSLLCGLPSSLLHRLQLIQNTAARILTRTPKFDHIKPVLCSLHWLPVEQRIKYKVLLLVFKAQNQLAPVYIQDLVTEYVTARRLRSADQHLLTVPHTSSSLVQSRAFSVAGPHLWNGLPQELRSLKSIDLFKSRLKTHLFKEAFH
jgi:hypothetical protein